MFIAKSPQKTLWSIYYWRYPKSPYWSKKDAIKQKPTSYLKGNQIKIKGNLILADVQEAQMSFGYQKNMQFPRLAKNVRASFFVAADHKKMSPDTKLLICSNNKRNNVNQSFSFN